MTNFAFPSEYSVMSVLLTVALVALACVLMCVRLLAGREKSAMNRHGCHTLRKEARRRQTRH